MDTTLDTIWRFVRGDMPTPEFEHWAYNQEALEERLGTTLYMEVIGADYRDPDAVYGIRLALERFARSVSPLECECVALPDKAVVDMGDTKGALDHFEEVRHRGQPYWWLSASRCTVCGSEWLVAQEERHNDIFLLRRLTGEQMRRIVEEGDWPPDFDRYETLLCLGREAGHSVVFADPIGDSSLAWSMRDLALARPGIGVSELAELLNLGTKTAAVIAREVVITHGVEITFDTATD